MLDDRNTTPDPELVPFAPWTYEDNATGWGALLGDAVGGADVSPYGAPARLTDFAGLPPAYIEVGELDIFRDEAIVYARNLVSAGVRPNCTSTPRAPQLRPVRAGRERLSASGGGRNGMLSGL